MSDLKPNLKSGELNELFASHFELGPTQWSPIDGGDTSMAYFLEDDKVLRLNVSSDRGFNKDRKASELFSSVQFPIPTTLKIGSLATSMGKMHYSITERVGGTVVKEVCKDQIDQTTESMLEAIEKLTGAKPWGKGFDSWNPRDGNGKSKTWQDTIYRTQIAGNDPELHEIEFYDLELRERAKNEIDRLVSACPELRHVVHGDYSVDNVLAEDDKLTGVIDWYNSLYGDPVYDIAWLDFGSPELQAAKLFKDRMSDNSPLLVNYEERIRCYQLLIGINGMAFLAKHLGKERYTEQQVRTSDILDS